MPVIRDTSQKKQAPAQKARPRSITAWSVAIVKLWSTIKQLLRDPIWQGIGAIVAIVGLVMILAPKGPPVPVRKSTATPTSFNTLRPTQIPIASITSSPTRTLTQTPTQTSTSTPTSTTTRTLTSTPTQTSTPTSTSTTAPTASSTPTVTQSPVVSATPDLSQLRVETVVGHANDALKLALTDINKNWARLQRYWCGEQASSELSAFKDRISEHFGIQVTAEYTATVSTPPSLEPDGRYRFEQTETWTFSSTKVNSYTEKHVYTYMMRQTQDKKIPYCIDEYLYSKRISP